MCDAKVPVARCATRVASSRRPKTGLGFWLVTVLLGSSCGALGVRGQEDYDYGYGRPQQPMHAGGGGEGGGLMKPLAAVATSFFAMKLIFSSRRKHRSRQAQIELEKSWEVMKKDDFAQINQQFNQMEASLTASLNEKVMQSKQLEQFLYSLPDVNNDGLITRYEFDKYMNDYKRTHPELTDLDLPRFEDMDHNNNGHINFHEWEEYQMQAMGAM